LERVLNVIGIAPADRVVGQRLAVIGFQKRAGVAELGGNIAAAPCNLSQWGCKVTQDESFFVEPKLTDAEVQS